MLLDCKQCSALVEAREIAQHLDRPREDGEPQGRWTFASCPRCASPMLAVQCDYGEGFDEDAPLRLYPAPDRRLAWTVPQSIRDAFSEAVACFKAKAYTASAIMCRKALEGLCSEHGVKEKTLALSLQKLKDTGVIESRLFEWAEELRHLGNVAAHGVETKTTHEDASDILDFTEALTQYVFTYRDKFQQFKARRVKQAKPAGAA